MDVPVDCRRPQVFINARGLLTDRIGIRSADGGNTWGEPFVLKGLVQPFTGCEARLALRDSRARSHTLGTRANGVRVRHRGARFGIRAASCSTRAPAVRQCGPDAPRRLCAPVRADVHVSQS